VTDHDRTYTIPAVPGSLYCPVANVRRYLSLRTTAFLEKHSSTGGKKSDAFYLQPNMHDTGFCVAPIRQPTLANILQEAATALGLKGKYNTYSLPPVSSIYILARRIPAPIYWALLQQQQANSNSASTLKRSNLVPETPSINKKPKTEEKTNEGVGKEKEEDREVMTIEIDESSLVLILSILKDTIVVFAAVQILVNALVVVATRVIEEPLPQQNSSPKEMSLIEVDKLL